MYNTTTVIRVEEDETVAKDTNGFPSPVSTLLTQSRGRRSKLLTSVAEQAGTARPSYNGTTAEALVGTSQASGWKYKSLYAPCDKDRYEGPYIESSENKTARSAIPPTLL